MKTKTNKTPTPRLRKSSPSQKSATVVSPRHARPSIGDPELEQMLPADGELPDLDNETVHRTERPEGAILEDDDLDDEVATERQEERDEDVSESNPLRVGHLAQH